MILSLAFFAASFALIAAAISVGGEPAAYVSGASALLVVLGTITVTAAGVRRGEWRQLQDNARAMLRAPVRDNGQLARQMLDLAWRQRREGPACLKAAMRGLKHMPLLRQGIGLMQDGLTAETVEKLLNAEADRLAASRLRLAQLLQRAADVAPALGLIGTLIGLVDMLGKLADPSALGPGMAVALLTTLYGAVLAHVVLLPLAARIEAHVAAERNFHALCITSVAALGRGEHPMHLESQLNALLPEAQHVRAA
ncbi:motility protein A [Pedomonas mirosovicensis]|uniref:motility protein A n=1 Tax=Pedomonas mirosovicensis TaxID=2908641 RepID=UPI0021695242|nr:MotA/TolQ/ExbB proton channel family protein [Pedomonas mirosovicensis]MCH8685889.1 MotA/TolQ/ExbB proton channel family protein [Pedomonas mirosovicensis]